MFVTVIWDQGICDDNKHCLYSTLHMVTKKLLFTERFRVGRVTDKEKKRQFTKITCMATILIMMLLGICIYFLQKAIITRDDILKVGHMIRVVRFKTKY